MQTSGGGVTVEVRPSGSSCREGNITPDAADGRGSIGCQDETSTEDSRRRSQFRFRISKTHHSRALSRVESRQRAASRGLHRPTRAPTDAKEIQLDGEAIGVLDEHLIELELG
jgi:hypothetical protein